MSQNAKVIIRLRPLLKFQDEPAWITTPSALKCMHSKAVKAKINKSQHPLNQAQLQNYTFNFDRVVDATYTSEKVYKSEIRKIVQKSVNQSSNSTIVAYGQTCSGKTYTLLGIKQAPGFIPCIFRDIFLMQAGTQSRYAFHISYTEIYNQKLYDLLNPKQSDLKISNDPVWGVQVSNETRVQVHSFEQCLEVLDKGEDNRRYGQKINHERSSRSHTLMKIYIQKWDQQLNVLRSAINVVDLAGSERLTINDQTSLETGHINKSLFQFSNVISKLSENKQQHIPYRDSKLTRLLQNSLTVNSNLAIVFCISPAVMNFSQSVSTLRLATKAKKVEISNEMEIDAEAMDVKRLQQEVRQKNAEIKKLKQKISLMAKQIDRLSEIEFLHGKANKQNKKQNKSVPNSTISLKMMVLLDHENFMLSPSASLQQIDTAEVEKIKAQFVEQISKVYEGYAHKIMKQALRNNYCQEWLKIEEICFANIFYSQDSLLEYKLPLLQEVRSGLSTDQQAFQALLDRYIEEIKSKLQYNLTCKGLSSARSSKSSPKYVNQSPIFQQSTIQVVQIEEKQAGSILLSWGCKKDNRVFKSQHPNTLLSQLSSLPSMSSISCGAHHSLIVAQSGQVYGWGKNDNKQICNSKQETITMLKEISLAVKVVSVAAGWAHSLFLSQEGQVYSCGFGEDGQLGHGDNESVAEPKIIDSDARVLSVYAGHSHSGFITVDQHYYAFGFNKDYRLMTASSKNINIPTRIPIRGVIKASLGVTHTGLLTKYGRAYCGGVGTNSELGIDLNPSVTGYDTVLVPQKGCEQISRQKICPMVEVESFTPAKIIDISCGQCSTAIITDNGQLFTFGKVSYDRLGHTEHGPRKILQGVDRVKMGYRHGFAWSTRTKEVYGWGFNMYNQLGTLEARDLKVPQLIQSLSVRNVIEIEAGFLHSAAIAQ